MNDSNQKTIDTYDQNVAAYVEHTPHVTSGPIMEWLDAAVAGLPYDARILEVGSAFGRDANYVESLGYHVERTDATPGFVDLLQAEHADARQLNLINDVIDGMYDLIFANAVLLHFTRAEVANACKKVATALRAGGRFAFTLKQGDGEEWSEHKMGGPRFFCYWQKEEIENILRDAGFTDIRIDVDLTGRTHAAWLLIRAIK